MRYSSAVRGLPALLALSLLGGCQWYARQWYKTHPQQAAAKAQRDSAAAAQLASTPAATAKSDQQKTVVQAGTPTPAAASAPAAPATASEPERATTIFAPPPPPPAPEPRASKPAKPATATPKRAKINTPAPNEDRARRYGQPLPGDEPPDDDEKVVGPYSDRMLDRLLKGGGGDANMIGLFLMSHDISLSYAKLAYQRAEEDAVQAFAKRVITDHTQLISSMRALVAEHTEIVPTDNMLGRDLRDRATMKRDSLADLTGTAFDRAYIATEVAQHRLMLALLDEVLLDRARDDDLRDLLGSTRPVLQAHLAHAQQLQTALAKRR